MQIKSTQVLLATALITVFDTNGNAHLARALLDCASQSNFISSKYCTSLKLKRINTEISVVGINQITSNTNYKCNLTIQSRFDKTRISISCLILPKICDQLPGNLIDISQLSIPAHLNLADPNFTVPGEIDILLGAELFWQLLCVGQIKTGPNNPVLQSTKLGWIVSGALGIPSGNNSISKTQCNFNQSLDIQEQLAKFWSIETFPNEKFLSAEEMDFEAHFSKTIKQNSNGRFIVTIPFKTSLDELGDSLDIAKKRFYSLERKLQRNLSLKQRYTEFIDEYVALGHMSQICHDSNPKYKYYLPHHGVVKESSSTTKLRVVFDGSCPSTTGISINDLQMVGPTIQRDLFSILLRFRQHSVVISADIIKMYRQVLVDPGQRALQRIVWRSNPNQALQTFDLNTVTYGTASASFLAIRCLHELANQNRTNFPIACQAIDEDFYVDDLLSGADTIERATLICEQVSHVLRSGCFELSKWKSNNIQIYKHLQDHSLDIHDFGAHENAKTLGLLWSCKSDQLFYNIDPNTTRNVTTKRIILSIISQIFDPLGLLGPCTIVAKILLQGLWLENISWDDEVSPELRARWLRFTEELTNLNKLEIPRHAIGENYVHLELHCFSDASESAYGTCAYIRSTDNRDKVCVRLLCAKSKVAPIKTLSIPRLELCAALLSTKLADAIVNSLNVNFSQLYFWTDSTITLAWIGRPASSLKTFVANRVAKIQDRDASHVWRHVGSSDNPADLLSRGISPKLLQDASIWWHGPAWLAADYKQWPNHVGIQMEDPPELKTKSFINTSGIAHDFDIFKKFSTLNRLQRTIAYCFRFYNNCKAVWINSDVLSVQELSHALHTLIKLAQIQCYNKEIGLLLGRKTLQTGSAMLKLNPFVDEMGLLRVGGRLSNSEFEFDRRHPIILPPKHALTNMIAHYEHKRLLHCGSQTLLNSLREHYWPMSGRNLTRKIVHECVVCFRNNPRPAGFIMGNLPKDRVTPTPPFYNTGVDYAGPFEIRDRRSRGYKVSKAYVCLFVCLSVKAIHLELVTDLTTEGFLAAFRRFTARRGKPANVYSDNGSNFLGARNELLELGRLLLDSKDGICEASSNESITWHFIPPRSPHFGGLWEAGVKSMKYHLKRVLGGALLTYVDFSTVLTQIESVLNSRPISPISSDPNDLNPLTPAHFLIGRPTTALPDVQLGHIPENRLGRFQHLQRLQQHFWSRWTREYISQLQQRLKWPKTLANLEIGSLVLIQEENLPPLCWRLGRVTELHPGKDGVVRVVTMKTSKGVLKRAVNKICPFPSDSDNCFLVAIKPSEIISM